MTIDENTYIKDLEAMKEKTLDEIGLAFNRGLESAIQVMEVFADEYYENNKPREDKCVTTSSCG